MLRFPAEYQIFLENTSNSNGNDFFSSVSPKGLTSMGLVCILDGTCSPAGGYRLRYLGNSVMVARLSLDQLVGVRVPVPQMLLFSCLRITRLSIYLCTMQQSI